MSGMCLELCEDCGKAFLAGPKAFLCPACRRKQLSEAAKERRLNKIGNDAYSEQCAIARKERQHDIVSHDGSRVLYCKENPRTEVEIRLLEEG